MNTFNSHISQKKLPLVLLLVCVLLSIFALAGYRIYLNDTRTASVAPDTSLPLASPPAATEMTPPASPPAKKPVASTTISVVEASEKAPAKSKP